MVDFRRDIFTEEATKIVPSFVFAKIAEEFADLHVKHSIWNASKISSNARGCGRGVIRRCVYCLYLHHFSNILDLFKF